MAFQPREAGEGLTPRSYMPAARLYEAEPATYRGGGHISEVIKNCKFNQNLVSTPLFFYCIIKLCTFLLFCTRVGNLLNNQFLKNTIKF